MDIKNVITQADIRYTTNKKRNRNILIFLFIIAVGLIIGLIIGTRTHYYDSHTNTYGDFIPAHDTKYVGWYGLDFYYYSGAYPRNFGYGFISYLPHTEWYTENIVLVFLLYSVLFAVPFVFTYFCNRISKNSEVIVSDESVSGNYVSFISKKSFQLHLNEIDRITVSSTFLDKLRTGKTIGICSASGVIKIHFVQNADNVASAIMDKVKKIKNPNINSIFSEHNNIPSEKTPSTKEKLMELNSMKEAGLISEEEYQKKREDLLSKM